MTDAFDGFLQEDDEILASVLEESLRHYREVEVPLQSMNLDRIPEPSVDLDPVPGPSTELDPVPGPSIELDPIPGPSINLDPVPGPSIDLDPIPTSSKNVKEVSLLTTVIDLCESPKKCQTVQSRLSYFFRKLDRDKIRDKEINSDNQNQDKQTDQIEIVELNSSPEHNDSLCSLPAIFYKKPDADGFHLSSGSHYVYPSNFPVREYQMEIIKTALFHNTLVSLPTGLGKTFIAAVVMYNFYRWYPMGKVVFMAPTRPLVAQQIEACHSIMGIPKDITFEMTGNIPPEQRYLAWKKHRVFFLTPQVLANDLSLGKCPSEMLKCIIVDEAHRATKDYAYVQVLKHLVEENRIIRIVGLSATPGTTVEAVSEVIQNLSISRLEFRTDESPDVARYTNKKDVECVPVKLTNAILNVRSQFLVIYDKYSRRLKQYHALSGNVTNLAKFQILGAKQKFLASHIAREMPKSLVGCLINDFTICMSLAYALELLIIYGIKVFYLQSLEISENHKCLSNDADFQKMLHNINRELNSQDLTWSHPKLIEMKKIVQDYFGNENTESNSKIIIFCQYRLVVVEVFELLKTFGSSVKPVMFVGQSLKEKGGLPQKKQLEVMRRFKSGDFNVLIATSVAEEGLDIGEVDLIICLEANKSPIKFVQRLGRTGRKRSGKCITLLTEGKEQMKYKSSVASSKTLVMKMLKNKTILSKLAQGGPRLIPKHIYPKCLMIHVKKTEENLPEIKKGKGKKKSEANNIMQFVELNGAENEEGDGLDVFQNIKDKPKRRSKKQKTEKLESKDIKEIECSTPVDDNNMDFISTDSDFIVTENNVRAADEHNGVIIDLDCFSEEEKAFDEWLQSCKQTDSVVINDLFFKLLRLFTDCSTADNNSESELHKCNFETANARAGDSDVERLFESQRIAAEHGGGDHASTGNVNEQWQISPALTCGSNRIANDIASGSVPNRKRAYDERESESDSEDLFESNRFNGRCDEPVTDRNSMRTSPVTCGGLLRTTDEEDERKVGFSESHESSPSVDIEDDTEMSEVYEPRFLRSVGEKSWPDVVGTVGRDADVVEAADGREEDQGDEDDLIVEDVDLEDLFKSQRADRYIEKYNDNMIRDNRTSPERVLGRSSESPEDGKKTPESAQDIDGTSAAAGGRPSAERTPVRDDNDAISLDDSPEFFSWRLPTKRARTEVANSCRSPVADFSTPPSSQARDVRFPDSEAGNVRDSPPPTPGSDGDDDDDDDDMDFMFIDYCSGGGGGGDSKDDAASAPKAPTDAAAPTGRTLSSAAVASPRRFRGDDEGPAAGTAQVEATRAPQPYDSGSVPLNILKACNLFKPGISLKMSAAASKRPRPDVVEPPRTVAAAHGSATRRPVDDMSPIHPPSRRQWPPRFSQSTPKVTVSQARRPPETVATAPIAATATATAAAPETFNLLTSSSDSDVFVRDGGRDETPTARGRTVRKRRRRRKPKKKLVFIDDEADVSYFNNSTTGSATAAPNFTSSSSENGDDGDFDSSFIDDDVEKSEPSTSITKQYLRSVKSPTNVRGVFKIPQLTRHHYNMDVYSQAVDRNDHNSYEEDSFCVNDESELISNTSSNTSAQQTSDERPSKPHKRKRILSPQSSDSSSPDQLNRIMMRKRAKAKMALDFS